MRHSSCFLALAAILVWSAGLSGLSFTQNPSLGKLSDTAYTVGFAVSESTDVEVSIVRITDSSLVRHLAAGKLGPSAPAPLIASSLSQTLTWDGRDDFRRPVTGTFSVRVRAGMNPVLDRYVDRTTKGRSSAYTANTAVMGLSTDGQGNVYLLSFCNATGGEGGSSLTLRAYDAETGGYRRMLWPFAAGMEKSSILPYRIMDLPGADYQMRTVHLPYPTLSIEPFTYPINDNASIASVILSPKAVGNRLFMANYLKTGCAEVAPNGAYASTGALPFVTSPAYIPFKTLNGPMYLYPTSDGQSLLLSGVYNLGTDTVPVDTGFWRDGSVYKINKATGAAALFIQLNRDTMPKTAVLRRSVIGPSTGNPKSMAAIHGTAADDSGRVFICDRLHNQVGIYDASGTLLKAVPVDKPDLVEVNRKTGELYVTTRDFKGNSGYINTTWKLYKFSDWRAAPAKMDSVSFAVGAFSFNNATSTLGTKASMAVYQGGAKPVIWWAGCNRNVVGVRDDGAKLVQFIDFADSANSVMMNYDRIAVDPKKEQVYVQNGYGYMTKIENWSAPAFVQCSTSTRTALYATDMTVAPDGSLYACKTNNSSMNGGWNGPLHKFSTDHLHVDRGFVTQLNGGWYGSGFASRGFDISVDGKLAIHENQHTRRVRLIDTNGTAIDTNFITPLPGCNSGGAFFDLRNNLYVGVLMRTAGHVVPAGYTGDTAYNIAVGSVVKFAAGQKGSVTGTSPTTRTAVNAARVYAKAGLGPYSGMHPMSSISVCVCRAPKFDVDPYGRLFIPNAITGKVAVVDNEDNLISAIGQYGNYDALSGPGVGLIWPVGAAASEDYIYVTDMINQRLARIRMNYALDNMPGLTDDLGAGTAALLPSAQPFLSAAPNPFGSASRITFVLSEKGAVTLSVHDLSGRLVNRLVSGVRNSGAHTVRWNAEDMAGRAVAPGVYVYRFEAGGRVLTCRSIRVR